MKVYIQFDFEGVAGFVIRDDQDRNIPSVLERTGRFKKIATSGVSAAAEGAFAAGADEVVIWDSHGQGNTLLVEELTERANLITGEYARGPWLPFFDGTDIGIYIGGHAMEGTPRAVTPHTIMNVNGVDYGEVGMFINCCGGENVPVVLVSGDTAVQLEIQPQIPNSEFVVTKEAIGPSLAKTITPSMSCKKIFEAAKRGVERADEIKPFILSSPFRFSHQLTKDIPEFVYEGNDATCLDAYRMFLKANYGYDKGWQEYTFRN